MGVAQWLVFLGGVDIHADDDGAFQWACANGHLGVAQWLLGLGGVDIHARKDFAFRFVCERGRLVVARWLLGMGGVDVHAVDDDAVHWACRKGHLGLGRWLVALDPSWAWPEKVMRTLQAWSEPRDVWMRAVVTVHGTASRDVHRRG
jgi:hypothetical protein